MFAITSESGSTPYVSSMNCIRMRAGVCVVALFVLVATDAARADTVIEIVAVPGDVADSTRASRVLDPGDQSRLSIDSLGRVLFSSDLVEGSTTREFGYFTWRGATPERLVLEGDGVIPQGGVSTGPLILTSIDDAFTTSLGFHLVFSPTVILRSRPGGGFDSAAGDGVTLPGACPTGFRSPAGAARAPVRVADGSHVAFLGGDALGDACDYGETSIGGSTDGATVLLRRVSTDNFAPLVVNLQTELPDGQAVSVNGNSTLRLGPEGHVLFRGGAGGDSILLASPGSSALNLIARVGDPAPGTDDTIFRVDDFTLGPDGDGGVRVAWSVRVEGSGDVLVYDSVLGAGAPLFRTGDTIDGVTFSPEPFAADPEATLPRLAVADDSLIVVAEASGPLVAAKSDAVWRALAVEEGVARDILVHSGLELDVGNGVMQTVTVLHQAIVSPDGHVAVVVDTDAFGTQAIAMEGVSRGSDLITAVLSFVTEMPSRDEAPRFASDLVPVNAPRLVPPGHDGRPGRMNDDGLLVFNASAKSQFGNGVWGVYTVTVRDVQESDVRVTEKKGRIVVVGDGGDADITIELGDDGDAIRVIPGQGTTVNGEATDFAVAGRIRSVDVDMGAGNDDVDVRSESLGDKDPFQGDLTIGGGAGADTLDVEGVVLKRSLELRTEAGLSEFVKLRSVEIGRDLVLLGSDGEEGISLHNVEVGRRTRIRTGDEAAGLASFLATTCVFGQLDLQAGRVGPTARFDRCEFEGNARFRPGDGDLHGLSITGRTVFDGGGLTVDPSSTGRWIINLRNIQGLRKLVIGGGPGDDEIQLDELDIDGKVAIDLGGTNGEFRGDLLTTAGSVVADGKCTIQASGLALLSLPGLEIDGTLKIQLRGGELGHVRMPGAVVGGSMVIASSTDRSDIGLVGVTVGKSLKITTGDGADALSLTGGTIEKSAVLKAGPGNDAVTLTDTRVGRLFLDGGDGVLDVLVDTAQVDGKRKVRGFEEPPVD